jgi:hypothetical protein
MPKRVGAGRVNQSPRYPTSDRTPVAHPPPADDERYRSARAQPRSHVCGTAALLQHGRVVATGRPEDVLTQRRIGEVFGVRAHVEHFLHYGKLHVQFLIE